MLRTSIVLSAVLTLGAAGLCACGDDSSSSGSDGGVGQADGGGGMPPAPQLGAQIDRIGRPGVNTALTDPFDLDETGHGMVVDRYNSAAQADWSTFTDRIKANLAILDGLDRNCGNQLLADAAAPRYSVLAGALADDRLYVNAASGTCTTYLAVEANATGVVPNDDCGGRTPPEDVIDETYSVLAAGTLSGVTDGVSADDEVHSTTDFPFLAAPN